MLSYEALQQDILKVHFQPVYLLSGSERFLRNELLSLLCERFLGKEESRTGVFKVEKDVLPLSGVIEELQLPVFFSGGRRVAVVESPLYLVSRKGGDPDPLPGGKKARKGGGEEESLQSFWEGERSGPGSIIVFCADEPDRRRRVYKLLEKWGAVVDCSPLKGAALQKWVARRAAGKGKSITGPALEALLLSTGGDLYRVENELNKMVTYMMEDDAQITEELVDKLIYRNPGASIFKLVDALGSGAPNEAYTHLLDLYALREPPPLILHMIARHFRLLLEAKCLQEEGYSIREATPALKVQPFVASNLFSQGRSFSRRALSGAIQAIHEADVNLKTGQTGPETTLEILLCRLSALRREQR